MLALGLEGRMAATAYLDDVIDRRWKAQFDAVSQPIWPKQGLL